MTVKVNKLLTFTGQVRARY